MINKVYEFARYLGKKYEIRLWLSMDNQGRLILDDLVVPKNNRCNGIGTKVINEITSYADENNMEMALTIGNDPTMTSRSRMKRYYKRFGFLENKGRNKDFTTTKGMIRPKKEVKDER